MYTSDEIPNIITYYCLEYNNIETSRYVFILYVCMYATEENK